MADDDVSVKVQERRRRKRSRRGLWEGRRSSDILIALLLKVVLPGVGIIYGYDFVRVDSDNFTARRVETERRSAEERVKALEQKIDALLDTQGDAK